MAIKFRIGNLVVITTDSKKDKSADSLDREFDALAASVDDIGSKVEERIKSWIKNDRIFDGFRNTYARIFLLILGLLTVFGFGALAYNDANLTGWYVVLLLLTVLAQQISVRYVFNSDGDELVDEYQAARRDRAYRIAYKNLQSLVVWALLIGATVAWPPTEFFSGDQQIEWDFTRTLNLSFSVSANQAIVVFAGAVSLMNLQKYWAWGIKGEPFRSKDEPNN
jgi:hypothetical protein